MKGNNDLPLTGFEPTRPAILRILVRRVYHSVMPPFVENDRKTSDVLISDISFIILQVLFNPSFGKSITVFRSPVSKDHGRIRSLTLSEDKNNLFFIEEQKVGITHQTLNLYCIH
jgi:hypothetical protein